MKLLKSLTTLIISLASLGFTSTSWANHCGAISPNLQSLGDSYYDLKNLSKTQLQASALADNRLIDSISSSKFRHGEGSRVICFGVSELRAETRHFSLKEIEPVKINSYSEMVFQAMEYDRDNKVLRRSDVLLPLSDHFVKATGDKTLSFNIRRRHASQNQVRVTGIDPDEIDTLELSEAAGASLKEITTEVSQTSDGLKIVQSLYINGYLAEWFTWNLQ